MADTLVNYLTTLTSAVDSNDDLVMLCRLVEGTIVTAGCIEHVRKIVSIAEIHAVSSSDGTSMSPYSSSYFGFSDKGKKILVTSKMDCLVGPVDLSVTDDVFKKSSLSSFKGVMTRFEGIYNKEVGKITELCKCNNWSVPGVYANRFAIPSSGFVGYSRPKVKDLGTLDALLDLANGETAVHWVRAKEEWSKYASNLSMVSSQKATITRGNLEKLAVKIKNVIDNRCQHAGKSDPVKDKLTDLYELNSKTALSVVESKSGSSSRVQHAQNVVAYLAEKTADEWAMDVSVKAAPLGSAPIQPRTKFDDVSGSGLIATGSDMLGATPGGKMVTPGGRKDADDSSSSVDTDTLEMMKADVDDMYMKKHMSVDDWSKATMRIGKMVSKRKKKKKKNAASAGTFSSPA